MISVSTLSFFFLFFSVTSCSPLPELNVTATFDATSNVVKCQANEAVGWFMVQGPRMQTCNWESDGRAKVSYCNHGHNMDRGKDWCSVEMDVKDEEIGHWVCTMSRSRKGHRVRNGVKVAFGNAHRSEASLFTTFIAVAAVLRLCHHHAL